MPRVFWDSLWNITLMAVCAYTFGQNINDQSYGWAAFSALLGLYFTIRMAISNEKEA